MKYMGSKNKLSKIYSHNLGLQKDKINNKGVKGIKIDKLISSLVSLYAYDKDEKYYNIILHR